MLTAQLFTFLLLNVASLARFLLYHSGSFVTLSLTFLSYLIVALLVLAIASVTNTIDVLSSLYG